MPISMGLIYRKTGQKSNLILKVFITYAVERIGGGVASFMVSGHKGPQCFRRNPTVHVKYGHGKQYINNDGLGAVRMRSPEIKNCSKAEKAQGDDSSLDKGYPVTRSNVFSGKL